MKTLITTVILFIFSNAVLSQSWRQFNGGANEVAVYSFAVFQGDLIAGGLFDTIGTVPARSIARWDGSAWHSLGKGMSGTFYGSGVRCITEFRGNLIVGGYFDTAGSILSTGIASWNGNSWSEISGGVSGSDPHVEVLAVYNGLLYVGGTFLTTGSEVSSGIASWNGSTWKAVGNSIIPPPRSGYFGAYALAEYQGNLYLGGTYHQAANKDSAIITMWDGKAWMPVGGGVHGTIVKALTVYNGKLIVGGDFYKAGDLPVNEIAMWDGTNWSAFSSEGFDGTVYTFCNIGSQLFAGGTFYHSGNNNTSMIACWDGSVWQPLGTGMNAGVLAIINYPPFSSSKNIVVGGFFSTAGGVQAKHLATWGNIVGYGTINNQIPKNFSLMQNYPNPFNPDTKIGYKIAKASLVKIEVFDILGRNVATPVNAHKEAGNYEFSWSAGNLTSGTYYYRITAANASGEFTDTKKMVLVK